MDFSQLKKRGSNLKELAAKIEKTSNSGFTDERIFKPGFDAKASPAGFAIVRFLPNKFGQTYERAIRYNFNGKGGFYSEVSPKTSDPKADDPVGMVKNALWNMSEETGDESYKTKGKKFSRQEEFFANVYVEKDTVNPANVGKVMIYRFGYQIFKKLEQAVKPEFEDDVAFDPFDLWGGRPLKIKIVAKEMPDSRTGKTISVPNYENSEFGDVCELFEGDDERKQEIYEKTYDLSEFLKHKTFDELVKRFKEVYGEDYTTIVTSTPQSQAAASAASLAQNFQKAQADAAAAEDNPPFAADPAPQPQPQAQAPTVSEPVDEDDPLARFRRLAGQA